MDEASLENMIKRIPAPQPDQDFIDSLFDKIESNAEKIHESRQHKGNAKFLFPWQMSLGLTTFLFFIITSSVLVLNPTIYQNLQGYLKQNAHSEFSDEVIVTLLNTNGTDSVLVYSANPETPNLPLNVKNQINSNGNIELSLPRDKFRIVVIGVQANDDNVIFDGEVDLTGITGNTFEIDVTT